MRSGRKFKGRDFPTINKMGLKHLFDEGFLLLSSSLEKSKSEAISDWEEMLWIGYLNSIMAIMNTIQINAHGGILIVQD